MSNESHQVIVATGGYDRMLRFWDAAQGRVVRGVDLMSKQVVQGLILSPDTQYLAVLTHNFVRFVHSRGTSTAVSSSLEGHHEAVTAGGWIQSPVSESSESGGQFWTTSEDRTARIWSLSTLRPDLVLRHPAPVVAGALHPGERVLFTGDAAGCLRAWDLHNSRIIAELQLFEQDVSVKAVACSVPPAGPALPALVAVGNRSGRVWIYREDPSNPNYLTLCSEVQAHSAYVLQCSFSRDGRLLATCGADRVCRLWSVDHAAGRLSLYKTLGGGRETGHQGWVWAASFADDGAFVLTASSDGVAKLWRAAAEDGAAPVRFYAGPSRGVTSVALHDGSPSQVREQPPEALLPKAYVAQLK